MQYIKYALKKLLFFALHVFWIFPVNKKKIIFESFAGRQISCNPFYIYKYLLEHDIDYKFIWVANNKKLANLLPKKVRHFKRYSLTWWYHSITCSVYISNGGVSASLIPFRKKQLTIDTWHGGGAYKRVGVDIEYSGWSFYVRKTTEKNANISYFISSCKKFSEVYSQSYLYPISLALEIGMPRNDIFFNKEKIEIASKKVRDIYKIPYDSALVLYAPTFRTTVDEKNPNAGLIYSKHKFDINFDFEKVLNSVRIKYNKKTVAMFRGHHLLSELDNMGEYRNSVSIIDASDYPDMQELLCAADVFITDYSSCMWDFALTEKPGFLYTPDIAEYESDRGVYTPISTWPFEHAETIEALCALIEGYNEESGRARIKKHLEALGSYEDGHASEKVCTLIAEHCNK